MTSSNQGFFFSMSQLDANDLKLVVTMETGSRMGPRHPFHPLSVRPLIIGGGLVGLTLSSFLYLVPSLLCTNTFHPFLATFYLMAALSAPLITSVMVTQGCTTQFSFFQDQGPKLVYSYIIKDVFMKETT
jgi:hypothetical protein